MKFQQSKFFNNIYQKSVHKIQVDQSCQTMSSQDSEFDTQSLIKNLQTKAFENLVNLEKIFGKDIKLRRQKNQVIVSIDIKQMRQISHNHYEPLQITISCFFILNPNKPSQKFKYTNQKGILEHQLKLLQNLESQFQDREFSDWTLFYEFFIRTNKIINTIPKFIQTSLLDKRNLENEQRKKSIEQEQQQTTQYIAKNELALHNQLTQEEKMTQDKIRQQKIKNMFTIDQNEESQEEPLKINSQKDYKFQIQKRQQTFSRYDNDFEELEILGKGGFGKVFKVRNNIDGNFYAIKKVKIYQYQNNGILQKMLHEVETLSKLYHPNIVRYYQAWIEYAEDDEDDDSVDEIMNLDSSDITSSQESDSDEESDDYIKNNFTNQKQSQIYSQSFVISFGEDPEQKQEEKKQIVILFIQMEYCQQDTLKEKLSKLQLNKDSQIINKYFLQIIDALAYIHSKNIVHRDIKPQNIFFDNNYNVKIGDFGLAKISQKDNYAKSMIDKQQSIYDSSFAAGTPIYMSPEQKKGLYTDKSDMFSLGIILLELISPPFSTEMQRIKLLQQFQEDFKCPDFLQHLSQSEYFKLVVQMLQKDPSQRPSSKELFTRFQSQLYQQYVITDFNEYKNIIDYIFSNKERFQGIYNNQFDKKKSPIEQNDTINLFENLYFTVESQLKQFFCCKIQILQLIKIFPYLRINTWKLQNKQVQIKNIPINCMISLDGFKKNDLYLDCQGNFVLTYKEEFLRFVNSLNYLNMPLGKYYGFANFYKKQTKLLFVNLIKNEDEGQIYNEIETFKIIDKLLQNFQPNSSELICYKSNSILIDALVQKIKLKESDYQIFYQILQKVKNFSTVQLIEEIKNKIPYIKQRALLILEFLKIKEKNFEDFVKKIYNILPNDPLVDLYVRYEKNIIEIQNNIQIDNFKFQYAVLPEFDELFPRFHSSQIFWIVHQQKLKQKNFQKQTKNQTLFKDKVLIYGGRFENILRSKNIIANGFIFDFSYFLQKEKVQQKFQQNDLQIQKIFNSFSDSNLILIVSKFQPMLKQKLLVQDRLWQEGMKVKILYQAINNIKKNANIIKKFNIQHVIILEPEFGIKNEINDTNHHKKVKLISLQDNKEKIMEFSYCLNYLKKKIYANICNQNSSVQNI